MAKTTSKTRSLLDQAFDEFARAEASDNTDSQISADEGLDLDGEGEFSLDDGDDSSSFDGGEGDGENGEDGEGDLGLPEDGEGEFSLDEGEGENGEDGEGDLGDGSDDEGGEFSVDDSEESEGAADEVEAVYSSVEEIEAEFEAIAREQGLHELPQGVTASETIDFLLDRGAIWELRPVEASEGRERRRAFAAIDDLEDIEGADGEEGVESPVAFDDEADAELSPVTQGGDEDGEDDLNVDLNDEPTDLDGTGDDKGADAADSCDAGGEIASASVSTETNYHPVADAELIATASVQDVQMLLTNGEDPRWNVIIAGVPAAFISLSSIENGEAVRSGFTSQQYCDAIITAMSKLGVAAVLEENGAQLYANEVMASDLATSIRASVSDELSGEFTTRVVAMREDFLDRANLVAAGLSKGYFTSLPNALFAKAREVLAASGVHNADAAAMAIAAAAPEFFAVVAEKAASLMDKSPEVLADLRENIEDSAPKAPTAAAPATATASFGARLADQTLVNPAPKAPAHVQASTSVAPSTNLHALVGRLGGRSVRA